MPSKLKNNHTCNKETDIELIKAEQKNQSKLLEEIHHKLLGNGQPGLISKMDTFQGGLKATQVIGGILMAIFTIIFIVLNYVK